MTLCDEYRMYSSCDIKGHFMMRWREFNITPDCEARGCLCFTRMPRLVMGEWGLVFMSCEHPWHPWHLMTPIGFFFGRYGIFICTLVMYVLLASVDVWPILKIIVTFAYTGRTCEIQHQPVVSTSFHVSVSTIEWKMRACCHPIRGREHHLIHQSK